MLVELGRFIEMNRGELRRIGLVGFELFGLVLV